jgi:CBS domain-containing protein
MRIGDIMSEDVETIPRGASVGEARERMRRQDIHHLVVMDGKRVAGVVSSRDLGREGTLKEATGVASVMTGPVVTATRNTTLERAANMLRGNHVGCLPVVEDGRPIGILTVSDVLDLIGAGASRTRATASHWEDKHRGRRRARSVPRR